MLFDITHIEFILKSSVIGRDGSPAHPNLHEKYTEKVRKGIARYLLVRRVIIHSSFGFGVLTHPYRITARCTNNGWPSDMKRTEKPDFPSLINLAQSPACFMWFATSSSLRFIASFNGYSSLRRIPMVCSAPPRISFTSSIQLWTVFMFFFCYQRCTIQYTY